MRVFFDTNVVLDYVLTYVAERKVYYPDAKALYNQVAAGKLVGLISATSLTNISHVAEYYFKKCYSLTEVNSRLGALFIIRDEILPVFAPAPSGGGSAIVPVGHSVCVQASQCEFEDYEDAVQYYCAMSANATHIVTRNKTDFASVAGGAIQICTPQELRKLLKV